MLLSHWTQDLGRHKKSNFRIHTLNRKHNPIQTDVAWKLDADGDVEFKCYNLVGLKTGGGVGGQNPDHTP